MDRETARIVGELKDRMNGIERKLDSYTNMVYNESKESISETQTAIVDLEINSAESESAIVDLEIAVEELKQQIGG